MPAKFCDLQISRCDSFAISKFFKDSWVPKPEKSEFVKIDRGGYFLSLTVSGYHIITISSHSLAQKAQVPVFGTRVIPKYQIPVAPRK